MRLGDIKFNLKFFLIDKLYYEFQNKDNDEIVEIIRDNHKKYLHANKNNIQIVKPSLEFYEEKDFKYYTYCYNNPKNLGYWKLFLPYELAKKQNFEILEFSFVLFIIYKSNIYCVIGGSGITVIKKYIDPYFGIDLYQHFAKPNEDISLVIDTRGITGNLSQKSNTYNFNQSVNDSLDYSEIPKKIKIKVRAELRNGIFKKYHLDDESIMEVGSYFNLRKKISFEELRLLIIDIHNIREDKSKYTQLTLFKKITEEQLLHSLDEFLKEKIVDDVNLHITPDELNRLNNDIIEIVNFNKLEKFYECDEFRIRFRRKRKTNDKIINNRNKLYFECTQFIYNNTDNINDRLSIKQKLYELGIIGTINGKESTSGTFYSHIIAEIIYSEKKYFRIDNQWFYLEDRFIKQIKQEAINYYKQYKLNKTILNTWDEDMDEDTYNTSHKSSNHYILDKVLKENIELCDILYLENDSIYFIHVKDGFNTQMRNLSSQVILSAKRLWNDINSNSGSNYFINTIKKHNRKSPTKILEGKALFNQIINNDLKIHFVMAYNNRAYKNENSIKKIELSESNIALYSLVQTVKEILNYKLFNIQLIDISEI
ncbi:hypothetical protein ETU08_09525 [Apibacter muscae]|uniref:DUF6119 family protein n=1 Tax=Apibacter muscae TaxID=2509004 RepID=UPI0011AC79E8|nr:DUF6119 family protein [Apibacter muscae]TWP27950.1 hypothetical protein ETU08_09525 [Apibacter muscae]